jgi:hypothetical protein
MANPHDDFSVTQNDDDYFGAMVPGTARRINVLDKDLAAAPGDPSEGDRYIVPVAGWGGLHANKISEYHAYSGADAGWKYFTPPTGFVVWVVDEAEFYFWNGTAWAKMSTGILSAHTHYYEKHVVTAGEESSQVIDLIVGTYTTGNNSLMVFVNRTLLCVTEDYTETDSDTVTFLNSELSEGDVIIFRWYK